MTPFRSLPADCGPCLGRGMRGVYAVSSDEGPCARHASRALRRACGQGAVLSLCMVRPGSGRFGVGFWVGFWVGLRARDFPTERVLSRTPLIIRTVDQIQTKQRGDDIGPFIGSLRCQCRCIASSLQGFPYLLHLRHSLST